MHQLNAHKPCLVRLNGEQTDVNSDNNSHLHENVIISCGVSTYCLNIRQVVLCPSTKYFISIILSSHKQSELKIISVKIVM